MALKDLSPRQMVQITAAWLDPERERPRLASLKLCAPLIDDIEAAHDGILKSHRRQKKANDELSGIQQRQIAIDQVHDRKARGAHAVLTGFADLADAPEDAAIYLEIRDQLFADGLRFISASYSDEAGEVKLARDRLGDDAPAPRAAAAGDVQGRAPALERQGRGRGGRRRAATGRRRRRARDRRGRARGRGGLTDSIRHGPQPACRRDGLDPPRPPAPPLGH